MREIGGNPNFTPLKSPISILGKRICSKTGVPLRHLWWILVYTAKREMSEEKRVSPMIFLTGNAVDAGVWKPGRDRVAPHLESGWNTPRNTQVSLIDCLFWKQKGELYKSINTLQHHYILDLLSCWIISKRENMGHLWVCGVLLSCCLVVFYSNVELFSLYWLVDLLCNERNPETRNRRESMEIADIFTLCDCWLVP